MKRIFFCIIILLAGISSVSAQSGMPADTVRTAVRGEASPEGMSPSERSFCGREELRRLPAGYGLIESVHPHSSQFTLEIPDASKDYSRIFQLNPNVTYSQGLSNIFSLSNSRYFSSNPFGLTGFWGSTDNLQMGSFTLKNGMRIHTYGEYDKDGWKVPNPSALPWEKNNFKGAFELKSANGSFGIRIGVQQGRHVPY